VKIGGAQLTFGRECDVELSRIGRARKSRRFCRDGKKRKKEKET
jgi:hypothetical protein